MSIENIVWTKRSVSIICMEIKSLHRSMIEKEKNITCRIDILISLMNTMTCLPRILVNTKQIHIYSFVGSMYVKLFICDKLLWTWAFHLFTSNYWEKATRRSIDCCCRRRLSLICQYELEHFEEKNTDKSCIRAFNIIFSFLFLSFQSKEKRSIHFPKTIPMIQMMIQWIQPFLRRQQQQRLNEMQSH